MSQVYDVDYFIRKFEAIPDKKWHSGAVDYIKDGKCCALGFCGLRNDMEHPPSESIALENLFSSHPKCWKSVIVINDGNDPDYKQYTPKQRILAALYDIKKMQQPKHKDLSKELAILPPDEKADTISESKTSDYAYL